MTIETDVLIIGGGVAGSAMACSLTGRGYRVILLEKSEKPQDTARGDHIQPYVCNILNQWGVLDSFFEAGAKRRSGSLWFDESAKFLMDANVSKLDIPQPFFMFINHEDISEVFIKFASKDDNFSIFRPIINCQHISTNDDESLYKLVLKDKTEHIISTKLVVGADGIASNITKKFELERETFRYDRALAVLFSKEYQADSHNNLRTYLTDRGIVTMIPRANGGCKIGLTIDRNEVKEWKKMSDDDYTKFIGSLVPEYKSLPMYSAGIYPPSMIIAKRWVKDNLVLIGDACHGLHPGRSQGMNTTIKCIDQLVKLLPKDIDFNKQQVTEALKTYQNIMKGEINHLLESNHKMGLAMDKFDRESKVAEINKYIELENDQEKGLTYRMNSAGYGVN
jgi:2-polyprenyl-6-methoxyphenol hydroxylase-like FAD-dependent oxidoreductase|tara:strand:+ start:1067 stop:2248 length:1182 start_codon:yes stop_codon:yes gene_type:complete